METSVCLESIILGWSSCGVSPRAGVSRIFIIDCSSWGRFAFSCKCFALSVQSSACSIIKFPPHGGVRAQLLLRHLLLLGRLYPISSLQLRCLPIFAPLLRSGDGLLLAGASLYLLVVVLSRLFFPLPFSCLFFWWQRQLVLNCFT